MAANNHVYRQMVTKLLKIYQNERCLWDTTRKDYHIKPIRQAALKKLLKVIRTVEPDAQIPDVVKRIRSLRTCYRRERTKVEASMQYDGDLYEPTLWYYNQLTFLDDLDPESPENNNDDHETTEDKSWQEADVEEEINFVSAHEYPTSSKEEYLETISETDESEPETDRLEPSSSKSAAKSRSKFATKRSFDNSSLPNNVVNLLNTCIKRSRLENTNPDRHDIYCNSLAMKLRCLDNHQRIFAEKLINDVMFEAELGNLNTEFKLVKLQTKSTGFD
ncbi:uncharacterized protein LOC106141821 [Amyelois transitella]|uniref:uncharacterized protein LOC106141821 n=1 Tax=Amyelois transitella TaxID=680683 RepID=UPI00067E26A6|nr:uncharacterized protein LOC106141821 [Amyelois transitella]